MSQNINNAQNYTHGDYERLYRVYQSVESLDAPQQFNQLPQSLRNQIYGTVYTLANNPQTRDSEWGKNNAFRNFQRLQTAIQTVAYRSFLNLPREEKNAVANRIWVLGGRPQGDPNWGENHANDNAHHLFQALIQWTRPVRAEQELPRPVQNQSPQNTGFSSGDYVDDNQLEDLIRTLGVEPTPVATAPHLVTTTCTTTTSDPVTTQTTTSIQSTQTATIPRPRQQPFNWGNRSVTTTTATPASDQSNRPFNWSNRSVTTTTATPSVTNTTNSSSSTLQIDRPNLFTVHDRINPYSFGDFVNTDEDFERILQMLNEQESSTSTTTTTTTTTTVTGVTHQPVIQEDPTIVRKRAAIERLGNILSFGNNAINKFDLTNTVSQFNLDAILQNASENHACNRLLELVNWAGVSNEKRDHFTRPQYVSPQLPQGIIPKYENDNSSQGIQLRKNLSKIFDHFNKKRTQLGVDQNVLKAQARQAIDRLIDANLNCVDQMTSQTQDILLDLAVDAYVPIEGDRKLGKIQCRAGQIICTYKINLLRQILLRQNRNNLHIADLERIAIQQLAGVLGLQGESFTTGAYYESLMGDVQPKINDAIQAFWQEYTPMKFLTEQIANTGMSLTPEEKAMELLRSEVSRWVVEQYGIEAEDADEPKDSDINAYLSANYNPAAYQDFLNGAEWSKAGVFLILEVAGIIRQK